LKKKLYEKNWNVYSKKALGGINSVLAYLGRYTHRVAISNSRITNVENEQATFRYKNYQKKTGKLCSKNEENEIYYILEPFVGKKNNDWQP
jgi:hypothetical protein